MSREKLEAAAKDCAERCKSGDYCLEDEVICYALDYIEILEGVINKFSTLSDYCPDGTRVVEVERFEDVLNT
jgi:hypothetical protein